MLLWNIDNNPPVTIWPSDHINSGLGEKQVAVVQNRAIWWFIITHSLTTHSCGPKMLKRMTFAIVLTEGSILPLLWPPATTPMPGGEESWGAGHSQAPGRHRSHNSSWGRVSKHGPGWWETRPCRAWNEGPSEGSLSLLGPSPGQLLPLLHLRHY